MKAMMNHLLSFLMLLGILLAASPIAALSYDESSSGDLSGDPAAPTSLAFELGTNTVSGEVDGLFDTRDYLSFSIGDGQALTSLRLLEYADTLLPIPANRGFHALAAGPSSFIPSPTTAARFLGGDHLDSVAVGTDLLSALANAPLAGTGFSTPLGPGTYTYHVQQTDPIGVRYALEFVVVPEPSTGLLLLSGLALMGSPKRRDASRRLV